jgi:hypothetical protein
VLGAATANIALDEPVPLATIASPVELRGSSTAFEANVGVEVRQDGTQEPLGHGFVMGGSFGDMAPFDARLQFGPPSSPSGAIVLFTRSMDSGAIWEATVVRVHFAEQPGENPLLTVCGGYTPPRPAPPPGQMEVAVFFTCTRPGAAAPVPVFRLVPASQAVIRSSLEQLLAGPTGAELDAGLASWFSPATAGMLDSINLEPDGDLIVDFHDLRTVIPNASSSAGSEMLLGELDATVFQFTSVWTVVYRIEGDCEAFNEWLQLGGCEPRVRQAAG